MSDDNSTVVPDEPEGRGLDRGRIDDSIYQPFAPGPMRWGKGPDGLPSPEVRADLPLAPPLALTTMVCLPDTSAFVYRRADWGDELARFRPEEVKCSEAGEYYVGILDAVGAGIPWLEIYRATDKLTGRIRVEPLRPQCKFLAQQMVDMQDASTHRMVERLCTARRDEESFFVSLRDTQVHACELRSPRDASSEKRIQIFNETKIAQGAARIAESGGEFDVDAALKAERTRASEGLEHSGIFGDNLRK